MEHNSETKDNPIVRLTFNFSLEIIRYAEELEKLKRYVISRQLLASGTSIGANVMEAQGPQSKRDFLGKLKIAFKELLETDYWLQLCEKSENYPSTGYLRQKLAEIRKVLNKIIATTALSLRKKRSYHPKKRNSDGTTVSS